MDSTGTPTYAYDDLYRLTSVTFPGSRTVGMTTTTTFTWDVNAGVVLDDGMARYVYGPSGLIAQKTATDDFYYLADGLGSTMAITDDVGAVVRDYEYDVYGDVTGGTGSTPNEFDFAGRS